MLSLAASKTATQFAGDAEETMSHLSPTGLGSDGLVIVIALVVLLAYLNLVRAREDPDPRLPELIVSVMLPLLVTFGAIVVYESLQIIT